MGQLTEQLKKDFIKNGFEKKEATKKAHEYMDKYNLCRACGESITNGFSQLETGLLSRLLLACDNYVQWR
jgi:translation initiation factor 2 beta subunit (eIF-2beta)/eIF-5